MIKLYSGTPGSGKSLHLAEMVYNRIKYGKSVIGNFVINIDKIKSKNKGTYLYLDNQLLSPKKLIDYAMSYWGEKKPREGELLIILDESQMLFNSRDWSQKNRGDWLSFFSLHRHFGYDIILVAQFDRMLDRQIRYLIEYEYIHRKVNNYGKLGKIVTVLTLGKKIFICIEVWYPLKEKIGSNYFIANKKYYSIYDTFGMFKASA